MTIAGSVLSVLWNLLSPVKSWILSSYSHISNDAIASSDIEWTLVLDAVLIDQLYEQAAVVLDKPHTPKRFVNVYLDLMVHAKSRNWAPTVTALHNDPSVDRYCRSSLRPTQAEQLAAIKSFANVDFVLWGNSIDTVVLEQERCAVTQVAEAMMCVKGLNASTIVNLEWSTGISPFDPKLAPGLQTWQELLMPDLNACLDHRTMLFDRWHAGQLEQHPLNVLVEELAANYSLDPHGVPGKTMLYNQVQVNDGFADLSEARSGVRLVRLSGQITEMAAFATPSALTAVRESMWVCAFQSTSDLVVDCFRNKTIAMPAFFLGRYRAHGDSERYIESDMLDEARQLAGRTVYQYLDAPAAHTLPVHQYVGESLFVDVDPPTDVLGQYVAGVLNALVPQQPRMESGKPKTKIGSGVFG